MDVNAAIFLPQLEVVIQEIEELKSQSGYSDLAGVKEAPLYRALTRARSAIERVSGTSSPYLKQMINVLENIPSRLGIKVLHMQGILQSLHEDIKSGYTVSFKELIHGEVFSDFLEMADHLIELSYKDAAAVIAGSSLEAHLRQLCKKVAIDLEFLDAKGCLKPKKTEVLNAELYKQEIYTAIDHKNVTAWLGIRNKAAHGHYSDYTLEQVRLLISSIRDFMTRLPA